LETVRQWVERMGPEFDRLYERYGKPLEGEHRGEWIAIGLNGEVILGRDDIEVMEQATARFGKGNFSFRCIGVVLRLRKAAL